MVQDYYDNSGLYRKYGTDKTTPQTAGEFKTYGQLHTYEVTITLANAALTTAIIPGTDNVVIPAGSRIQEVEVITVTAATGATAALNLGLIRTDRTTPYDDDGFIAALAVTAMDTAGETNTIRVGSTGAGAFIGTTLANTGHLCFDYDTAAFTAGVIKVTIRFFVP